jgi:signal transduction histidine kinase
MRLAGGWGLFPCGAAWFDHLMGTPFPERSWRRSIGGRWAVSWQAFAIIGVASAVLVGANQPGSVRNWVVIAASSVLAMGAIFLMADITVLRRREERPAAVATVLAVGLVAGLARSGAVLGAAAVLDVDLLRPWPVVLFAGIVIVGLATVGLALAFDQVSRTRQMRAVLLARLADLREQEADRGSLADAMTGVAYAEVAAALEEAGQGLDVPVGAMTPADRAHLAAELRAAVDGTLRPLSHRLHAAASVPPLGSAERRGPDWSGLLGIPVLPLPTALTAGLLITPMSQSILGPLVFTAIIWLALAVPCALERWPGLPHRLVVPLALVLVAGAPAVAGLIAAAAGDGVVTPVAFATAGGLSFAITLMVSAVGAVLRGEEAANQRLLEVVTSKEVDALVADREIARASRELAEHLHGTVQSRLLAMAFALDEAAGRDDDEAFRMAVTQAREALGQAIAVTDRASDLSEALERVASLWRGFVDVRSRIDPQLPALAPALVDQVSRVVEEGVGNARKHGDARRVVVVVCAVGADLSVTVTDDGSGPSDGVAGMGSAWLEFVAPGAWSLAPGPDGRGAVLDVRLPMRDLRQPSVGSTA